MKIQKVTLIVLAYNQEQYIQEAINGALSQDYSPLEIIFSDDCSSDKTYKVMKRNEEVYAGPHIVKARKNRKNLGIVDHILCIARRCTSDLIVVASGDDYSYSNRVSELVMGYQESGAVALYSDAAVWDNGGKIICEHERVRPLERVQRIFLGCDSPRRYKNLVRHIPGYSAAYQRNFLATVPLVGRWCLNEDTLMTLFANLKGYGIHYVQSPLLARRVSQTSVSQIQPLLTPSDVEIEERRLMKFAESRLVFYEYFFRLADLFDIKEFGVVKQNIYHDYSYSKLVECFWKLSATQRLAYLFKSRTINELKYILPRLIGLRLFSAMKSKIKKCSLNLQA